MSKIIEQIMAQVGAPRIVEEARRQLDEEAKRRQEFYEWLDEDKKAEFVNGEIVVHSPAKKWHLDVVQHLGQLLKIYTATFDLGYVAVEKALIALIRNDYEPGICFFGKSKAAHFVPDQSRFPVPDLVVEVLSSNEDHDRITKFQDYQKNGIEEYWIIDPVAETLEQYFLSENGAYELQLKAAEGHVASRVIEGFRIPINAIFSLTENLKVRSQFLSST